jgi:putative ABC transport system substrate-binding protein
MECPSQGIQRREVNHRRVIAVANKTIGILHSGSAASAPRAAGNHAAHIKAFYSGLASRNYNVGENVNITGPLYSNDDSTLLAKFAKQLVADPLDVLVAAGGTASAQAAKKAVTDAGNTTIKIVFTSVTNPKGSGLVSIPTNPEGNVTGICALTSELDGQRLNLLAQLIPGNTIIGVLTNPNRTGFAGQWANLVMAGAALNLQLVRQDVNVAAGMTSDQIDAAITTAFTNFAAANVQAVLVTADPLFNDHRQAVLATRLQIPAIYQWREFVDATGGQGLMSFGTNIMLAYTLAGVYAGHILDKVAIVNLPVLQMTGAELIINLVTANAIPVAIPDALLAMAAEVIV